MRQLFIILSLCILCSCGMAHPEEGLDPEELEKESPKKAKKNTAKEIKEVITHLDIYKPIVQGFIRNEFNLYGSGDWYRRARYAVVCITRLYISPQGDDVKGLGVIYRYLNRLSDASHSKDPGFYEVGVFDMVALDEKFKEKVSRHPNASYPPVYEEPLKILDAVFSVERPSETIQPPHYFLMQTLDWRKYLKPPAKLHRFGKDEEKDWFWAKEVDSAYITDIYPYAFLPEGSLMTSGALEENVSLKKDLREVSFLSLLKSNPGLLKKMKWCPHCDYVERE